VNKAVDRHHRRPDPAQQSATDTVIDYLKDLTPHEIHELEEMLESQWILEDNEKQNLELPGSKDLRKSSSDYEHVMCQLFVHFHFDSNCFKNL